MATTSLGSLSEIAHAVRESGQRVVDGSAYQEDLQAAVDTLCPCGGVLVLPPLNGEVHLEGRYWIKDPPLRVPATNIAIVGSGPATRIAARLWETGGAARYAVEIVSPERATFKSPCMSQAGRPGLRPRVVLSSFRLDGPCSSRRGDLSAAAPCSGLQSGIRTAGVDADVLLEDLAVVDFAPQAGAGDLPDAPASIAVAITSATRVTLRRLYIDKCQVGIWAWGGSLGTGEGRLDVQDCIIRGNLVCGAVIRDYPVARLHRIMFELNGDGVPGPQAGGLDVGDVGRFSLIGCRVESNGKHEAPGGRRSPAQIVLRGACRAARLEGCYVTGPLGSPVGLEVQCSGQVCIIGNHLTHHARSDIILSGSAAINAQAALSARAVEELRRVNEPGALSIEDLRGQALAARV